MTTARFLPLAGAALASGLLSACSLAPGYQPPTIATIPPSFREMPGWHAAVPSDAVAKGDWWAIFNDPILDQLERQVVVSNQNIAAARAAYDQARAMVQEQRAAMLPTINLAAKAQGAGSFQPPSGAGAGVATSGAFSLGLAATWAPEVWLLPDNSAKMAGIQAQASRATLQNATLAAQGELALDYLQLRGLDAQMAVMAATVVDYERALAITTNMYAAGVAARSDVLQAQSALRSAQAQTQDLARQRALFEHAIAVLTGENPSVFAIALTAWNPLVPEVPSALPSELLQRRPDVAAAERQVAAANVNIGIQKGAFFPSFSLTAQAGQSSASLGSLFSAANSIWSVGLSGLLALLDFGQRSATVAAAQAAHAQSVASYRQTVLTAFQQTEDQLAAIRLLHGVADDLQAAAAAASAAETIMNNRYRAGTVGYSEVIVAQNSARTARDAAIAAIVNRQIAAVSLIQAIGGRWDNPPPDGGRWDNPP